MDEPSVTRSEQWRSRLRRFLGYLRRGVPFASGVLAALLALYLYNALTPKPHQLNEQDVNNEVNSVLASATAPPAASALVYQAVRPSIVLILAKTPSKDGGKDENGLGTGVVITDQGDILTALHVVKGASEIQVTFADGTESSAQISSTQDQNDIAVLRADKPPAQLYPAVLGNPASMNVGDDAFVVGNPLGLYSSMTTGVISGFQRTFTDPDTNRKLTGLIQIDAAVNPGNSGGPLLNRAGQVVGIVVGIVNPTGQDVFIGIGFAVPINVAGGALGSPLY